MFIILSVVLLSFLPFTIFTSKQFSQAIENPVHVAVITVDRSEVERKTLTGNTEVYHLNLPEVDCHPHTIQINTKKIREEKSNCPRTNMYSPRLTSVALI